MIFYSAVSVDIRAVLEFTLSSPTYLFNPYARFVFNYFYREQCRTDFKNLNDFKIIFRMKLVWISLFSQQNFFFFKLS